MKELRLLNRQCGATTAETFTYVLIVIVLASTAYGFYINSQLGNALAEALSRGEEEKALVEEYYQSRGEMPQSGADIGLDRFMPEGVLADLNWISGGWGEADSDPLHTGTLNGIVNLNEFGARFQEYGSGYLLIARGQEDGSVVWDCKADIYTPDALPGSYLPDSCTTTSESQD